MTARFRFVQDDDGHNYLIPADKETEFEAWELSYAEIDDTEEEAPKYEGEDFDKYRIDSMCFFTFTDPKED